MELAGTEAMASQVGDDVVYAGGQIARGREELEQAHVVVSAREHAHARLNQRPRSRDRHVDQEVFAGAELKTWSRLVRSAQLEVGDRRLRTAPRAMERGAFLREAPVLERHDEVLVRFADLARGAVQLQLAALQPYTAAAHAED